MARDLLGLVERARRGDRAAFGELVRKHQQRVYVAAYRMTGNHDDADDVAQEAFVRAYRGLSSFDARSDFFTWLYRIVINVALNHLRRDGRRRQVVAPEGDRASPAARPDAAGQADPRRALELKRMMLDVSEALDALSDTLRATLVLAVLEGLPYREVAEILDCPEGTVAWRVHEARQQLRGKLGQYLTPPRSRSTGSRTVDERDDERDDEPDEPGEGTRGRERSRSRAGVAPGPPHS